MKKTIILLFLIMVALPSFGQTMLSCFVPSAITSGKFERYCPNDITMSTNISGNANVTIEAKQNITMSNTNIGGNATVKIVAKQITINPGFSTALGANVIIEATILRSAVAEESEFEEEGTTALNEVTFESEIERIIVYSITGMPVYTSSGNVDISLLPLIDGVYIIEKQYADGSIEREKIIKR